jgi:hypothetical protein
MVRLVSPGIALIDGLIGSMVVVQPGDEILSV